VGFLGKCPGGTGAPQAGPSCSGALETLHRLLTSPRVRVKLRMVGKGQRAAELRGDRRGVSSVAVPEQSRWP